MSHSIWELSGADLAYKPAYRKLEHFTNWSGADGQDTILVSEAPPLVTPQNENCTMALFPQGDVAVNCSHNPVAHGDICSLSCPSGFQLLGDSLNTSCLNGSWQLGNVTCVGATIKLPDPLRTYVAGQDHFDKNFIMAVVLIILLVPAIGIVIAANLEDPRVHKWLVGCFGDPSKSSLYRFFQVYFIRLKNFLSGVTPPADGSVAVPPDGPPPPMPCEEIFLTKRDIDREAAVFVFGDVVCICGMRRHAEINGKLCKVVHFDETLPRYRVLTVDSGQLLSVKPENIRAALSKSIVSEYRAAASSPVKIASSAQGGSQSEALALSFGTHVTVCNLQNHSSLNGKLFRIVQFNSDRSSYKVLKVDSGQLFNMKPENVVAIKDPLSEAEEGHGGEILAPASAPWQQSGSSSSTDIDTTGCSQAIVYVHQEDEDDDFVDHDIEIMSTEPPSPPPQARIELEI